MNAITKFEVGKKYAGSFIGDSSLKATIEVVRRTESSVWVNGTDFSKPMRKKIYITDQGEEWIYPYGSYSMAPCVGATEEV